ncbi:MAG TPA: hypothetical protein VN193_03335 [Candidatus Angelobacter sp.]|jgi:hypothetical protein|nr:hypothetical protein [Candidatus Angelobacter sp.]
MTRSRLQSRSRWAITAMAVVPIVAASVGSSPAQAASASSASTRQIARAGTASFQSGAPDTTSPSSPSSTEIGGVSGTDGSITANRSHSTPGSSTPVGATTQPKQVTTSTPGLVTSFDALNHFQNRFGTDLHTNQFSLEPPDQGLCVGPDGNGNTRVLEVLNDVLRVYDTSGNGVTGPQALNSFLGYAPAINRSTGALGPFVTDPSCIYDAATGHWFLDVLTLDSFPQRGADGLQHFTGTNHLDLAVSNTSNPAGTWTVYRIPVQDDGSANTPNHNCSPSPTPPTDPVPTNLTACFGDYPHIGSDANGLYLTTNEYSFFGPEFHGAQVYALSKAQLAALSPSITVTQFDTHGADSGFALNGFTLWPSQTPGGGGDPAAGGTEYFLSSNAAAEAHDTGDGRSTFQASTQLLVWALSNTSSLSGTRALTLSHTKLNVGQYTLPPPAEQKAGNQPLRDCLNQNKCSTNFILGAKDPFAETSSPLDSNDTRMQQVTWVGGQLWGALDTGLSSSSAKSAGIEWFDTAPAASAGAVSATITNTGYVGLGNDNLTYPAIGITSSGTGVMAFTLVGTDFFPSAGYATIDSSGVGPLHVAAAGQGPDDGFTDYKAFGNPPGTIRPRWGDYGAAVPVGGNVWIASEYIGQTCNLSEYLDTNLRCGSTRTGLANWGTRISEVAAP